MWTHRLVTSREKDSGISGILCTEGGMWVRWGLKRSFSVAQVKVTVSSDSQLINAGVFFSDHFNYFLPALIISGSVGFIAHK